MIEAVENDYIKNIDIADSDIIMDHQQFPAAAYLRVTLKNNGDRKISNLAFEIRYYDEADYLIQKAVLKNALNEPLPEGKTGKYKIRLKGDIVDIENAQYPYDQSNKIERFELKITDAKIASR